MTLTFRTSMIHESNTHNYTHLYIICSMYIYQGTLHILVVLSCKCQSMKLLHLVALSYIVILLERTSSQSPPKGHCPPLARSQYKIFQPYTRTGKGEDRG